MTRTGSTDESGIHLPARDYVTPVDTAQIPNGQLAAVQGSPFDFTTPHAIGERIHMVRVLTVLAPLVP
jgi:hypothetical protein